MKIVSKFVDYYDSVGKRFQGVPGQNLWIREEREVTDHQLINRLLSELNLKDSLVGYTLYRKGYQEVICESNALVVAGQLYPVVKVINKTPLNLSETYCYEFSELVSEILTKTNRQQLKRFYDLFSSRSFDLYSTKNLSIPLEIWNELQSPVFLLKRNSYLSNIFIKNVVLIVNPMLKEFEFYKVKDPFTCYQELDQFFTRLTAPEQEQPQVADIYRLVEHGFDKKVSFRKRKFV